jgi:hypothetical protein
MYKLDRSNTPWVCNPRVTRKQWWSRWKSGAYDHKAVFWDHMAYYLEQADGRYYKSVLEQDEVVDIDLVRTRGVITVSKTRGLEDLLAYVQQSLCISWFWGHDVAAEVVNSITYQPRAK